MHPAGSRRVLGSDGLTFQIDGALEEAWGRAQTALWSAVLAPLICKYESGMEGVAEE